MEFKISKSGELVMLCDNKEFLFTIYSMDNKIVLSPLQFKELKEFISQS